MDGRAGECHKGSKDGVRMTSNIQQHTVKERSVCL